MEMSRSPHAGRSETFGFTLVEVMIVVAVIGLLAVIALPSLYSARKRAQETTCLNNLRQISSAKDQWAIENNKKSGSPDINTDLIGAYIKRNPECPAGGEYSVNDVSEDPACSAFDPVSHACTI